MKDFYKHKHSDTYNLLRKRIFIFGKIIISIVYVYEYINQTRNFIEV